jgi:cytochrome P450
MSGKCPVDHSFTMMDSEFLDDPYAQCPALLERPVFYAPELDAFVVTRFRDIDAMLPDTERYSNSNAASPITPPAPEALQALADHGYSLQPNLINADPPRHTYVKKFVADAISPRRLRALEPIVREWAGEQIDKMLTKGQADLFAELAFPLPALTGFSLIGFPREDLELLKSWCNDRVAFTYGRTDVAEQVRVAEQIGAFWEYTRNFVAQRIAEPTDDFTSEMVRHHFDEPEKFTPNDIASVLFGMSLAAHETTTNLIVNGIRRLLENPEQWEALVDDRSLIMNAVEECLRHDAPVVAWRRRAEEDIEIDGVTIPKGSTILMLFFTANRDPRQFDDPDVFDVRRRTARKHVTFGKGAHFCSGAPLARMEMRVVLELLTEKAPGMRLVPDQEYAYIPNIALRAPQQLLVELAPVQASSVGQERNSGSREDDLPGAPRSVVLARGLGRPLA